LSETGRQAEGGEVPGRTFASLLHSRKFFCLMGAAFLAYANISVFFGFYDHLRTTAIDPDDYGLLIGALAATALVLRPLISPLFHVGNARSLLFLGTFLAAGSLAAYSLAEGFWGLLLVRVLHGMSFAVVGTALMTLIVDVIPTDRSAQFFGYIAVVTLIPNTLVPPFLPFLDTLLGGFNNILLAFAGLTLLMFPLVWAVEGTGARHHGRGQARRLTLGEIGENLRNPRVVLLLLSMLLLYCGHALIFFFLDGYGKSIGIAFAGLFLTLSTVGEIGVRVIAGAMLDRGDKNRLVIWTLVGLSLCYLILAQLPGKFLILALGLFFGLGWGIAMPVFNSLIFDVSPQRFRAFNINLGAQMFQAGFFLGPIIGAPILAQWGYATIYQFCAAISFLAVVLMIMTRTLPRAHGQRINGTVAI
jgi:predicted MFS family arabinose efflux permease